jgi:hypothetical protein
LICGYGIMAFSTLVVTCSLWSQSTGLRWDPISLMDFIALFARCNALDCFSKLECTRYRSGRDRAKNPASNILDSDLRFRIGYWKHEVPDSNVSPTRVVYGIGLTDRDPGKSGQEEHRRVLLLTLFSVIHRAQGKGPAASGRSTTRG